MLCIVLRYWPMSKLKEALKGLERDQIERIALDAGTTYDYLVEQLANGHRKPSIKLARKLVELLPGDHSLRDLRPDIFGEQAA